jgi:hypothetical protein
VHNTPMKSARTEVASVLGMVPAYKMQAGPAAMYFVTGSRGPWTAWTPDAP